MNLSEFVRKKKNHNSMSDSGSKIDQMADKSKNTAERSLKPSRTVSKTNDDMVLAQIKAMLVSEKHSRLLVEDINELIFNSILLIRYILCRNKAEDEYQELKHQYEESTKQIEQEHACPVSKFDEDIKQQEGYNYAMRAKVVFSL